MGQLLAIFANVLAPIFALVLLGYIAGPRLGLDARTISRMAYFFLAPAFVFDAMSQEHIDSRLALRMVVYIIIVHLACLLLAWILATRLRRSAQRVGAYLLVAVFGNIGNFGVPITQFALGNEALTATALYFVALNTLSFIVGVAAANWNRQGKLKAMLAVVRTPALLAVPAALIFTTLNIPVPALLGRATGLLAGALVPVMLLGLGIQLQKTGLPRINRDMALASSIRLLAAPLFAVLLAVPFALSGLERSVGILQASMPVAVLASIIAVENNLEPEFVNGVVLYSTLSSLVTLAVIIALLKA